MYVSFPVQISSILVGFRHAYMTVYVALRLVSSRDIKSFGLGKPYSRPVPHTVLGCNGVESLVACATLDQFTTQM